MKDRYTLLSPRLLDELRRYSRIYRPAEWLFTDHRRHTPMDPRSASRIYQVAKKRAGIQKAGGIHTLRHAFATHLLESGIAVVSIQRLLGHARVETTAHYLHVTPQRVGKWASPLDLLRLPPVSPA